MELNHLNLNQEWLAESRSLNWEGYDWLVVPCNSFLYFSCDIIHMPKHLLMVLESLNLFYIKHTICFVISFFTLLKFDWFDLYTTLYESHILCDCIW